MPSEKKQNKPLHLESETVYKGYFDVKSEILQRPDGAKRDYTSLVVGWNAAVILAQDLKGRYILNREYRPPTKEAVLGPPGGSLEPGEDPKLGAQREFFEETGYWSDDITLIGACYPLPGICNQKIFFFQAKQAVKRGKKQLDPFEFIETEVLEEQKLFDLIRSGAPVDGILCTALWYKSLYNC